MSHRWISVVLQFLCVTFFSFTFVNVSCCLLFPKFKNFLGVLFLQVKKCGKVVIINGFKSAVHRSQQKKCHRNLTQFDSPSIDIKTRTETLGDALSGHWWSTAIPPSLLYLAADGPPVAIDRNYLYNLSERLKNSIIFLRCIFYKNGPLLW